MSTAPFNEDGLLSAHSIVPDQHHNLFFSGREGEEEKEQGCTDIIEVSGQLIVAVAAKLLVNACT